MNIDDFDTPKHAQFVANYFKKNMNGTRAYKETYGDNLSDESAAASASQLLRNPKVSQAVKNHLRNNIMEADEILFRLSEMGQSAHSEYITEDGTVDISRLVKDGKAHLIKGVKKTKYGMVYEFHDAKSALELHGKYYAMWKDRVQVESGLESEVMQHYKDGTITAEQAKELLGDNERTRELIKSRS